MCRRASECAARHGTTLKWSFAVGCKTLDDGTRVEDGGLRARAGHNHTQYWRVCKKASVRKRVASGASSRRSQSCVGACRWSARSIGRRVVIRVSSRRVRSRLARLGRESDLRVLDVTKVVASLGRVRGLAMRGVSTANEERKSAAWNERKRTKHECVAG